MAQHLTGVPGAKPQGWRVHHTVKFGLALSLGLIVLGVLMGRGTLIALATPLLIGALWSLTEHSKAQPTMRTEPVIADGADARTVGMRVLSETSDCPGVTLARVKVSFAGTKSRDLLLPINDDVPLEFSITSVRTGKRDLFGVSAVALARTAGLIGPQVEPASQQIVVLPRVEPLPALPVSATVRGLTGPRQSRRMGDGQEFRDVSLMRPGDRLRQIDWFITARNAPDLEHLYVRRNLAQAEATAMILVDSRDDVGSEVAFWGSAHEGRPDQMTSLDIARTAAASLAKASLDAGDRVGFEDLGRPRRPVLPGTGKRHLERIRYSLALAQPLGAPKVRTRAPFVPSGALVYVLSTFLDETALATVASLVRSGHRVIAIDTLPTISTWSLTQRQMLAWRLTSLDRQTQLQLTRNLGVTLVRWSDPQHQQQLAVLTATPGDRVVAGPGGTRP
ncbi:DUF58 domain-containing protein [Jonesiaceae bacterium BS-20]|uniref:DUF58 domain-containing protein n=1 Tax=Jonesiaceae bacterium BS-20 TaxID=3120821 RepID=A0AAU7DZL3_9MICO